MKRNRISLAIGLLLGVWASGATFAQESAATPSNDTEQSQRLDDIVVTARRREETLQEVPVAVSAFTADDLVEMQVSNIDGLQGSVPNMNIVQGRGSSSSVNVFIRGIGQPDALQTFDPGVGMYVDDVYYSRIQGALFNLFDVDHIEVLRGPQGTLYGKNSTGGAIKIVTKEPGDETTGSVEVTAGSFGLLEAKAYVATPLNDRWGISAAVVGTDNDGYVKDPTTRKRYNSNDNEAIRLKLVGRPSDTFKAVFAVDYTHQDNPLTLGHPEAPLIRTDLALGPIVLRPIDADRYDYRTRTSFGPDERQKLIHKGASAALTWTPSDAWTIKSITAWRDLVSKAYIDIDASEFSLGDVYVGIDQDQFSQELQAQYDNGGNLHATWGLYYMREHVPSAQLAWADDFFGFAGTPITFLRTIDDDLTTRSAAAYGQVNWEFAPSWTLGAGLRYTRETKDYDRTTSTFWGPVLASLNGTVAFDAKKTWNAVTPSLSLQKQFSDQLMGYVSANRGFKSGGFNGRANAVAEAARPEFDPEFVWTYEIGLKMSSADGRLLGGITAFHSNYDDFQARVSGEEAGSFPVLNAAKLKIDGVEFEGMALIGDGTRLSAQVGWMNARYAEFNDPRVETTPALAGLHDHVPFSPRWTARLAASQVFQLGDAGSLTVGGDVSYRDESWLSVDNRDVLKQDAFGLVGLFGIWDSADYRWQIRAGVRNLTDKLYKTDAQEFSSVGNIQTAYYGMPRNYYITARYNF
ncbi:MAG TPA: TonB-dependent receptor [Dokdonella sp.]|uniref:TonB-dependent receptor n=1 Tax=Dokdonella sp. TaxID=2291710 RepID=UPI0025C164B5|nr:TonB-dependent receptor [Dokdonella sp.]MBX3690560.1 TonB-dependent receptor [Dokdonella sp.]MCW5567207.1 TonB-dependent receptor [Dokdonella sp.]HNR91681.1 TonB-dependent receptor [Dokdonella sp.]